MDELTAAGITDPQLRASYEECKRLNALHGKTYYLATLLLPKAKRPFVHALYGFARYADEIVDDLASTLSDAEKAAELFEGQKPIVIVAIGKQAPADQLEGPAFDRENAARERKDLAEIVLRGLPL